MLFGFVHAEPCTEFCFFWLLNNIPDTWFLTGTKWAFPVNDTASGFYLQESFSTTSKTALRCEEPFSLSGGIESLDHVTALWTTRCLRDLTALTCVL